MFIGDVSVSLDLRPVIETTRLGNLLPRGLNDLVDVHIAQVAIDNAVLHIKLTQLHGLGVLWWQLLRLIIDGVVRGVVQDLLLLLVVLSEGSWIEVDKRDRHVVVHLADGALERGHIWVHDPVQVTLELVLHTLVVPLSGGLDAGSLDQAMDLWLGHLGIDHIETTTVVWLGGDPLIASGCRLDQVVSDVEDEYRQDLVQHALHKVSHIGCDLKQVHHFAGIKPEEDGHNHEANLNNDREDEHGDVQAHVALLDVSEVGLLDGPWHEEEGHADDEDGYQAIKDDEDLHDYLGWGLLIMAGCILVDEAKDQADDWEHYEEWPT